MKKLDNKKLQRMASISRYKKDVIIKTLGQSSENYIGTSINYQGAILRYFNVDGTDKVIVGKSNSVVLSNILGVKLKSSVLSECGTKIKFEITNTEKYDDLIISFVYSSDITDEIILDSKDPILDLNLIQNKVERMVHIGLKFHVSTEESETPFIWKANIFEIENYEKISGLFQTNYGYVFSNIVDETNIDALAELSSFIQYVSFLGVDTIPADMNYLNYNGKKFLLKRSLGALKGSDVEEAILRFSYSKSAPSGIRKGMFNGVNNVKKIYLRKKIINFIKLSFHTLLPEELKLRLSIAKQKTNPTYKSVKQYRKYVDNTKVDSNLVFVESSHGRQESKNLTLIADEMKLINSNMKIVVSINDMSKALNKDKYNYVLFHSKEYYKALAQAKYLLNDVTLVHEYVKRDEQIYVNTWHGTPIKKMGIAIEENHLTYDNIQRNFLMADKVYLSNDDSIKYIGRDYFADRFNNNFELMPSVRNSIFYDKTKREEIRSKYNLTKKVVVWMPTWRGEGNQVKGLASNFELFKSMENFQQLLGDEYEFYVKVHPLVEKFIRVTGMKVVPNEDIYDFLTAADCLVTDYSSIMFDFLNADKKICLYTPDLDEYKESRGLYYEPSRLGLQMSNTPVELAADIMNGSLDVEYKELKHEYCPLDCIDGAKIIAENILNLTPSNTIVSTDKRRVLLYPGQLQMNGITTAAMGLIEYLASRDDVELTIYFPYKFFIGDKKEVFKELYSLDVNVLVNPPTVSDRFAETIGKIKIIKHWDLNDKEFNNIINFFKKDCERTHKGLKFDDVIHFEGYHGLILAKLIAMSNSRMHLFVHNNLLEESKTKNNINMFMNRKAREHATSINVVNETVMEVLFDNGFFDGTDSTKVSHVRNIINANKVIARSNLEEEYLEDLDFVSKLNDKDVIKICSIGRLSHEKGFIRLIEAFEKLVESNPGKRLELFLIAGYGPLEAEINSKIRSSKYVEQIDLKVGINPHPILKNMDLMIMASFYEGLPMTLFEAMALGIPVMSTDIPGPGPFLRSGYGYTCENSMLGIYDGLNKFINGEIPKLNSSIESFNNQAKADISNVLGLEYEN